MSSVGWLLWAVFVVAWPALVAGQGGFATGCSEPNVFLQWFKTVQPDAVLSTLNTSRPTGGWEVCDNTWGTGGTCCDVANLKAGYEKVMVLYKRRWDQFILGLKRFKDVSQKLKQVAGGSSAGLKFEQAKKYRYTVLQGESFTAAQAQEIMDKLDSLESDLSAFRESVEGCFTATQRAITSIFCQGCHDASSFERLRDPLNDTADLYYLKPGSCTFVTEACVPVWKLMFNLQAQMLIAFEVKQMESGTRELFYYRLRIPFFSLESKLFGIFQRCAQPRVDTSTGCDQQDLDGICSMFIYYKGPSNLQKVAESEDLEAIEQTRVPLTRRLQIVVEKNVSDLPKNVPRTGYAVIPDDVSKPTIDLSCETKPLLSNVTLKVSVTNTSKKSAGSLVAGLSILAVLPALWFC